MLPRASRTPQDPRQAEPRLAAREAVRDIEGAVGGPGRPGVAIAIAIVFAGARRHPAASASGTGLRSTPAPQTASIEPGASAAGTHITPLHDGSDASRVAGEFRRRERSRLAVTWVAARHAGRLRDRIGGNLLRPRHRRDGPAERLHGIADRVQRRLAGNRPRP